MKLYLILDENRISEELKTLVTDFDPEVPMMELKWVYRIRPELERL